MYEMHANPTAQRLKVRANKTYREALDAAENAHDGISGQRAERAGWRLAGMHVALSEMGEDKLAAYVAGLLDNLSRNGEWRNEI